MLSYLTRTSGESMSERTLPLEVEVKREGVSRPVSTSHKSTQLLEEDDRTNSLLRASTTTTTTAAAARTTTSASVDSISNTHASPETETEWEKKYAAAEILAAGLFIPMAVENNNITPTSRSQRQGTEAASTSVNTSQTVFREIQQEGPGPPPPSSNPAVRVVTYSSPSHPSSVNLPDFEKIENHSLLRYHHRPQSVPTFILKNEELQRDISVPLGGHRPHHQPQQYHHHGEFIYSGKVNTNLPSLGPDTSRKGEPGSKVELCTLTRSEGIHNVKVGRESGESRKYIVSEARTPQGGLDLRSAYHVGNVGRATQGPGGRQSIRATKLSANHQSSLAHDQEQGLHERGESPSGAPQSGPMLVVTHFNQSQLSGGGGGVSGGGEQTLLYTQQHSPRHHHVQHHRFYSSTTTTTTSTTTTTRPSNPNKPDHQPKVHLISRPELGVPMPTYPLKHGHLLTEEERRTLSSLPQNMGQYNESVMKSSRDPALTKVVLAASTLSHNYAATDMSVQPSPGPGSVPSPVNPPQITSSVKTPINKTVVSQRLTNGEGEKVNPLPLKKRKYVTIKSDDTASNSPSQSQTQSTKPAREAKYPRVEENREQNNNQVGVIATVARPLAKYINNEPIIISTSQHQEVARPTSLPLSLTTKVEPISASNTPSLASTGVIDFSSISQLVRVMSAGRQGESETKDYDDRLRKIAQIARASTTSSGGSPLLLSSPLQQQQIKAPLLASPSLVMSPSDNSPVRGAPVHHPPATFVPSSLVVQQQYQQQQQIHVVKQRLPSQHELTPLVAQPLPSTQQRVSFRPSGETGGLLQTAPRFSPSVTSQVPVKFHFKNVPAQQRAETASQLQVLSPRGSPRDSKFEEPQSSPSSSSSSSAAASSSPRESVNIYKPSLPQLSRVSPNVTYENLGPHRRSIYPPLRHESFRRQHTTIIDPSQAPLDLSKPKLKLVKVEPIDNTDSQGKVKMIGKEEDGSRSAAAPECIPMECGAAEPLKHSRRKRNSDKLPVADGAEHGKEIYMAIKADEDGDLPLHIAVVQGNIEASEMFVMLMEAANISIDTKNTLRQTALHLAVITRQPNLVHFLLGKGASPDVTDRYGNTCIHLAVEYQTADCLEEIASRKVKPQLDQKNYEGLTPLHQAVLQSDPQLVDTLVKAGAKIDVTDGKSGRTPLHYATESKNAQLVEQLLMHDARVNVQSFAGNTALHTASERNLKELMNMLVKYGADPTIKNANHETYTNITKDTKMVNIKREIIPPKSLPLAGSSSTGKKGGRPRQSPRPRPDPEYPESPLLSISPGVAHSPMSITPSSPSSLLHSPASPRPSSRPSLHSPAPLSPLVFAPSRADLVSPAEGNNSIYATTPTQLTPTQGIRSPPQPHPSAVIMISPRSLSTDIKSNPTRIPSGHSSLINVRVPTPKDIISASLSPVVPSGDNSEKTKSTAASLFVSSATVADKEVARPRTLPLPKLNPKSPFVLQGIIQNHSPQQPLAAQHRMKDSPGQGPFKILVNDTVVLTEECRGPVKSRSVGGKDAPPTTAAQLIDSIVSGRNKDNEVGATTPINSLANMVYGLPTSRGSTEPSPAVDSVSVVTHAPPTRSNSQNYSVRTGPEKESISKNKLHKVIISREGFSALNPDPSFSLGETSNASLKHDSASLVTLVRKVRVEKKNVEDIQDVVQTSQVQSESAVSTPPGANPVQLSLVQSETSSPLGQNVTTNLPETPKKINIQVECTLTKADPQLSDNSGENPSSFAGNDTVDISSKDKCNKDNAGTDGNTKPFMNRDGSGNMDLDSSHPKDRTDKSNTKEDKRYSSHSVTSSSSASKRDKLVPEDSDHSSRLDPYSGDLYDSPSPDLCAPLVICEEEGEAEEQDTGDKCNQAVSRSGTNKSPNHVDESKESESKTSNGTNGTNRKSDVSVKRDDVRENPHRIETSEEVNRKECNSSPSVVDSKSEEKLDKLKQEHSERNRQQIEWGRIVTEISPNHKDTSSHNTGNESSFPAVKTVSVVPVPKFSSSSSETTMISSSSESDRGRQKSSKSPPTFDPAVDGGALQSQKNPSRVPCDIDKFQVTEKQLNDSASEGAHNQPPTNPTPEGSSQSDTSGRDLCKSVAKYLC